MGESEPDLALVLLMPKPYPEAKCAKLHIFRVIDVQDAREGTPKFQDVRRKLAQDFAQRRRRPLGDVSQVVTRTGPAHHFDAGLAIAKDATRRDSSPSRR
jgi:hypothetical protein